MIRWLDATIFRHLDEAGWAQQQAQRRRVWQSKLALEADIARAPALKSERFRFGESVNVPQDGFAGTVQGFYVTREGHPGVNVQQHGTRVVHVYRETRVEHSPSG